VRAPGLCKWAIGLGSVIRHAKFERRLTKIETVRAWTPSEFKDIAEKAAKVAGAYNPARKIIEAMHGAIKRRAFY